MLKKIITIIFAVAIAVAGILGINRLRYFERSAWIFKTNNEQSSRGGRFERGGEEGRNFRPQRGSFDQNQRPDVQNLPDSVRQRILSERGVSAPNDSIREGRTRPFPGDREGFREGGRPDGGRGGHDFRGGNSVRLSSVSWFLAVFAFITLITVIIDNQICSIRRRKKNRKIKTAQ